MNLGHSTKPTNKPPFAVFVAATIVVFFCTLSAADSIGFVPYYIDGTDPNGGSSSQVALSALPQLGVEATSTGSTSSPQAGPGVEPVELIIPAANIDLPVQNPTTTDVDTLDNLLKNGPAHYIDSAQLGQSGTMIIFAHSSHLPIVTNKMFQAFNNIPNLNAGDTITVVGADGKDYLYSVDNVVKTDVDSGTTIDTSSAGGTKLVLVTCDTLTGVSSRFVLTADYVGVVSGQ